MPEQTCQGKKVGATHKQHVIIITMHTINAWGARFLFHIVFSGQKNEMRPYVLDFAWMVYICVKYIYFTVICAMGGVRHLRSNNSEKHLREKHNS